MIRTLALLVFALLSSAVNAQTKLTALPQGLCASLYYGEESSTSSKYSGCIVRNVKDYGAVGNGSTNDHGAIQNAINAALSAGGGVVYFPPISGNCYLNNSSLTFGGGGKISLVGDIGDGTNGSNICSNFGGASTNVTGTAIVSGIIRLTVASTAAFTTGNYVRVDGVGGSAFANATWSVTVVDGTHLDLAFSGSNLGGAYTSGGTVQLPAYVIDAPSVGGSSALHQIKGLSITNNSLAGGGVRWGDVTTGGIYNTTITAGLIGVDLSTNVFIVDVKDSIINGISDNTGTGLYMGQVNVTGSSFTGWDMAIVTRNVGQPICGNRFEVNNTAVVVGAALGNVGADTSSSLKLCTNSYERNLLGIYVRSAGSTSIEEESITGSIGPDHFLTGTSTWLAGTVTATSLRPHFRSGTQNCNIENAVPSGYNTPGHVSCTFSGSNTITYPIVSNPGANTNAGAWAVEISGGISVCGMTQSSIKDTAISVNPVAAGGFGINFQGCGGFEAQNYNAITSSGLGAFNPPTAPNKAGWVLGGNNRNFLSFSMVFADLPGQAGVQQTPALFGATYDLTDCGTVVWGAVAFGGSPGTNCRVWYNAGNWTVIGK